MYEFPSLKLLCTMSINMKIYLRGAVPTVYWGKNVSQMRTIEFYEHEVIPKEDETGEGKFSFNLKTRMIFCGTL